MLFRLVTITSAFLLLGIFSHSQTNLDSLLDKLDPQKFAAFIGEKSKKIEEKLVEKSMHTLAAMQQQEEKIYKRLLKTSDSLQAKASLEGIKDKYNELKSKLGNPAIASAVKQYIPKLDSLSTSLKFLDASGAGGKVKGALTKVQSLQDKFQQAEEIKKFIRERKEQLKAQLEKLGIVKQLKKINKQLYYYSAQLKEYKEILKNSKKIEKKALELLAKTKVFQEFMRKNSMVASLFRMPHDPNDPSSQANLAGLQTRADVNALIQQQIASGGPNARQQFQQNIQQAQSQLNQLKDKILKAGGVSSEDIMPEGFKPNDQKTKSFLKRLEYGTNMQTQKATYFFPVTSDIGLSLGYKLNDKSIIGIGASYKMGWGRGWNHIRISHQGVGLRSFIDWKLKGSLYISGGYEQNYKTAFSDFNQLKDMNGWQQSGLLGISKVVPTKSKVLKKTKVQLLWDFMSYQQIPRSQPLVFRIGYGIN